MTSSSAAQIVSGSQPRVEAEMLRALAAPETYPGKPPVAVHETHASWVFVAGERAYKIKKPVSLGFLDYGTLARRREACLEEVHVNQALAPGLYLGVRAVVRSETGFSLAPDDAANAVEYAVEMLAFREQDTFAGLIEAGSLTRRDVAAAAGVLADFHRSATVVDDWTLERVSDLWRTNIEELRQIDHPADWNLDGAAIFGEAFVRAHAQELKRRALQGLVRDGHGDLRCEHVLARPQLRIVDRIEFDPQLRRVDIAADLAFLMMDLEANGQRWAARELCDAYRHAGMSPGSEALRCFYAAHLALVRAKVSLLAAGERPDSVGERRRHTAQLLWSLSERLCWRARRPLAIVVCGPAASGKSMLAAELSRRSEMQVVSSDALRKRMAHLGLFEPARPEHYSARFTRATYEQLTHEAIGALGRGEGVIVDATCRSRGDRTALLNGLTAAGARLMAVRCEVSLELSLQRAARRMKDPQHVSDATPQIAAEQFDAFEELDELPPQSVLRLDTAQDLDDQVAEVTCAVDGLYLDP